VAGKKKNKKLKSGVPTLKGDMDICWMSFLSIQAERQSHGMEMERGGCQ
jgi:hypothetical protein